MKGARGSPLGRASLPTLGETLDFMRLIWEVDHALQRASKRMESGLGVTGPQRLVIRIVGRFPGLPAGHLATLLRVHPSTLTGILKRLERKGLMRKRADPRDGRRLLLSLTEEGRVFNLANEGIVEGAVQRALERSSPEQIAATRGVLGSIVEHLGRRASGADSRPIRPAEGEASTRSCGPRPRHRVHEVEQL
jgi:MarR family transcriptional regulator, organic hydroperoxide resistance regulator